jgi:hypothetical protein
MPAGNCGEISDRLHAEIRCLEPPPVAKMLILSAELA